ncbi:NUDIX hydrolase [Actinoplanes derwentensis]|uniref:NUDIX domain-containing protein n=1 Tax=Actinoplanes derwentensis TaxID=113562 RepID=A0A1H2DAU3_9ACTN|nr:NUDIX domain-containing protein [Actinoplanes derwentensis]GID81796.1 hypothetical protein Ade03nite_07200 [Actinoplanes derwentensis]SDT79868.1 NUDIX domain-containing protein [Actinoplanes derwentensis]
MYLGPSFSAPVTSSGTVLWRGAGNAREVAVVHHPRGEWGFPKGRTAPGEHMAAAAVRAVSEEAGIAVALGPWLGAVNYVRGGWPEHVDYFAAEAVGDEQAGDLLWLSPERAADALSRPDDVWILHEFQRRVTVRTSCFILRRGGAYPAQSVLSAYGVREQPNGDLEYVLRIAGESFDSGRPAAVCAELAAIQELFGELCRRRPAPVPVDATVPEGGLLVLHGTPDRIVTVERHLV